MLVGSGCGSDRPQLDKPTPSPGSERSQVTEECPLPEFALSAATARVAAGGGHCQGEKLVGWRNSEVKCCTPGVTWAMASRHSGTARAA